MGHSARKVAPDMTTNAFKKRPGRPSLPVDPDMIRPGLVDTHTPVRFLSGLELERRRMWERDRRRRQLAAARNRTNASRLPVGEDWLAEARDKAAAAGLAIVSMDEIGELRRLYGKSQADLAVALRRLEEASK